ncbi:class I SAM-dependent methyltransferase [Actinoplanes sp. NPDC051470]|uniref:class I SAM-dependent methyltransferase n=1 Tax=Actinoplanes sp. NPDC051470 TaxID=3157224 RepID=UPI00341C47EC
MTSTRSIIDLEAVLNLYRAYAEDLGVARDAQRALLSAKRGMRPKLDDIEAEITYLLVRDNRPARVVEIGTFHGWSTSWLLRALADNGTGHLHSYDLVDHVLGTIPGDLSDDRWTFHHGDARTGGDLQPSTIDHLFIDAAHTARFARWYVADLLEKVNAGVPVSVHDVYHHRHSGRFGEGRVVLDWLVRRGNGHFTASATAAPSVFEEISAVKRSLGLDEVLHRAAPNPMIYFTTR